MECQGGRIDAAHHNGHAVRALSETLAFEKAIEVNFVIGKKFLSDQSSWNFSQEVVKAVNLEETLILVTADHAHTMRCFCINKNNHQNL